MSHLRPTEEPQITRQNAMITAAVALIAVPALFVLAVWTIAHASADASANFSNSGDVDYAGVMTASWEPGLETDVSMSGVGWGNPYVPAGGAADVTDYFTFEGTITGTSNPQWTVEYGTRVSVEIATLNYTAGAGTYAGSAQCEAYGYAYGISPSFSADSDEVGLAAEGSGTADTYADIDYDGAGDVSFMYFAVTVACRGVLYTERAEMGLQVTGNTSDGNGIARAFDLDVSDLIPFALYALE